MGKLGVISHILKKLRGDSRDSGLTDTTLRRKPQTVLVAWEVGGGMGHVHRLIPIANAMRARGHRLVFVLREQPKDEAFASAFPGARVIPAPRWSTRFEGAASNYPDMLLRIGYDSAEILTPLVRGWQSIYADTGPGLILCDHSPTAILAAAGQIPVVHIGSGFATPPVGHPFRVLYPPSARGAREREAQVFSTIRETQAAVGGPVPKSVSELLGFAENFSCCLPEIDPYHGHRPLSAWGPVESLPKPQPAECGTFLFSYLAGQDARVPLVLRSLAKAKIRAGIYIRRPTAECLAAVEGSSVTLYDTPQNLITALTTATAILHHGGVATTEMALAIGRPQFLLPRHLEQHLTADAVEEMGCGLNLLRDGRDVGAVICRELKRGVLAEKGTRIAARIAERPARDVASMIVSACSRHIEKPQAVE